MGMHITLTDIAGVFRFVIPIVPSNFEISEESDNSDFQTTKSFFRILGLSKNKTLELNSYFPVDKDYDFVENGSVKNGWLIHTFIKSNKDIKKPIRCVVTTDNKKTVFNELVSIDKYKYGENGAKDIEYSLTMTEFKVEN